MFCFKNKSSILIIVMSFKIQGACPLQVAPVQALRGALNKFVHATNDMRDMRAKLSLRVNRRNL